MKTKKQLEQVMKRTRRREAEDTAVNLRNGHIGKGASNGGTTSPLPCETNSREWRNSSHLRVTVFQVLPRL